jgi:hypothetical protein
MMGEVSQSSCDSPDNDTLTVKVKWEELEASVEERQ